jgi:uncharacterized protein YbjQ (UPF0145 family)
MIVSSTNHIEGREVVQYLGIVRGIVVRAPNIAQGLVGGLQSIFGGNIGAYEDVCEQARNEALMKVIQHATNVGADAIIGMRYDATEFVQGATEVLAYGTAVKLSPKASAAYQPFTG